jgi:predicted RNA binding protein YcfA (HicA-like mRNA interferase family)
MSKVPSLSYIEIIHALKRDGWTVVLQEGSHIRLVKHTRDTSFKITIPAHKPVKRSTLEHILKQAHLSVDEFLDLL